MIIHGLGVSKDIHVILGGTCGNCRMWSAPGADGNFLDLYICALHVSIPYVINSDIVHFLSLSKLKAPSKPGFFFKQVIVSFIMSKIFKIYILNITNSQCKITTRCQICK